MKYKVITNESEKLRVRESPSLNSKVVGYVLKDNVYDFNMKSDDSKWMHLTNGEGWCSVDYLSVQEDKSDVYNVSFSKKELEDIRLFIDNIINGRCN